MFAPKHARRTLIEFGVPAVLAAPLGLLLPLAELAVAAALVPTTTAWWGACGALFLLFLFIAAIALNLARGRTPECRCFGQLHSAPVGWTTLTRNAALAVVASFLVSRTQDNVGSSVMILVSYANTVNRLALAEGVVIMALLVATAGLLLEVLRQQGRLLLRIEGLEAKVTADTMPDRAVRNGLGAIGSRGLPIGAFAPGFSLSDLNGQTVTLDAICAAGRR
jgi:hypothetical protein